MDKQTFINAFCDPTYHYAIAHQYAIQKGLEMGWGQFSMMFHQWCIDFGGNYSAAVYYFMDLFGMSLLHNPKINHLYLIDDATKEIVSTLVGVFGMHI